MKGKTSRKRRENRETTDTTPITTYQEAVAEAQMLYDMAMVKGLDSKASRDMRATINAATYELIVALTVQVAAYYPKDVFPQPDGSRDFSNDCYTAAGERHACAQLVAGAEGLRK